MRKIILLLLIGGGAAAAFFKNPLPPGVFDRTEPEIEISDKAGASAAKSVRIADAKAGVKEAVIEVEQDGKTVELERKTLDAPAPQLELEADALGKRQELKEGPAKIIVKATDGSYWANASRAEAPVELDFRPPVISVLSLQHKLAQGGVELVLYKASDTKLGKHGVRSAGVEFPGFPIAMLDPELAKQNDLYGAFFAVPLGFDALKEKPEVYAEDAAMNRSAVPLTFRLDVKPQQSAEMKLTDAFLQQKIPALYQSYRSMAGNEATAAEDLPGQFTLVNGEYRKLLDQKLKGIFRSLGEYQPGKSILPPQWREVFVKPMGSATSSTFGEKRTYYYEGREVGQSTHNGFDLASTLNDAVGAANDGVVAFAGDLGIYGNTVLINHGLGLFSLYGHLSSIGCAENDKVKRGQEIGRTGQTGLAGGDHLHFEFRLLEAPVAAIEWWDPKWIQDNIFGKLAELKEQLGLTKQPEPAAATAQPS